MMSILDYGSGNLSAIATLVKLSNVDHEIVSKPEQLKSASKILLPGVGAFDRTVSAFHQSGMADAMKERLTTGDAMALGICIGMHVLASSSEEGKEPGLGLIPGKVTKFDQAKIDAKPRTPHMGWNNVKTSQPHPLLNNIDMERGFYFLHNYHYQCADEGDVLGMTDHGYPFHSVINRGPVYGVQFHPEKSHSNGVRLIQNFLAL